MISYETIFSGLLGAIIGVILGSCLSYYVQIRLSEHSKKERKKFLATVFLNEIDEINHFISDLKRKGIDGIKSIKFHDSPNRTIDTEQYCEIIITLGNNSYFTSIIDIPLKRSFEIFHEDIYSFEDPELIRDLIELGRMVYVTEDFVRKYYNRSNDEEGKETKILLIVSMIEHIKNKIEKILSEGKLKKFAST